MAHADTDELTVQLKYWLLGVRLSGVDITQNTGDSVAEAENRLVMALAGHRVSDIASALAQVAHVRGASYTRPFARAAALLPVEPVLHAVKALSGDRGVAQAPIFTALGLTQPPAELSSDGSQAVAAELVRHTDAAGLSALCATFGLPLTAGAVLACAAGLVARRDWDGALRLLTATQPPPPLPMEAPAPMEAHRQGQANDRLDTPSSLHDANSGPRDWRDCIKADAVRPWLDALLLHLLSAGKVKEVRDVTVSPGPSIKYQLCVCSAGAGLGRHI
jgi:hypothetical protein